MSRSTTFQKSLFKNLLLVVVLLGGVLLTVSIFESFRIARRIAGELSGRAINHVEADIGRFLEPVRELLEAYGRLQRTGLFPSEKSLETYEEAFTSVIKTLPQISSAKIAYENGKSHTVLRTAEGWLSRTADPLSHDRKLLFREWSEKAPERSERWEESDYRVQERPWYVGAVECLASAPDVSMRNRVYWTEPYEFAISGEPGITASLALRGRDDVLRVLCFDVLLKDVSSFTGELKLGETGMVFALHEVLDEDELVIVGVPGGPEGSSLEDFLLKPPSVVGGALAKFSSRAFKGRTSERIPPTRFHAEDDDWWGTALKTKLSAEHEIWIVALVREGELLASFTDTNIVVAASTAVALLLALLVSRRLSRSLGGSIEELVQRGERMARLDFAATGELESNIEEIHVLAATQERMRRTLQDLSSRREDLAIAHELRGIRTDPAKVRLPGWEIGVLDEIENEVGGGVYEVARGHSDDAGSPIASGHDSLALLVGMVPGQGVIAAQRALRVRDVFRACVRMGGSAAEFHQLLTAGALAELDPLARFAASVAILDGPAGGLAGVLDPDIPLLHWRASERSASWHLPADPGDQEGTGSFSISVSEGDVVVLLTESVLRTLNPARERYGREGLEAFLGEQPGGDVAAMAEDLRSALTDFGGGYPVESDRTVLLLRKSTASPENG
jgi:hypothetical protein